MKNNWQTKKLGNLCQIELGKTPYRENNEFWDTEKQTNKVWLSIADLLNTEGNVIFDSKEYVSEKGARLCKIVREGTLLASFKLTLGRLAFAGKDLYTNEAIAALNIKNEKELSKDYLYHYLSFFDWHGAVKGDIKIKGKTLNKAKLKEIDILFPSLPEQHRIVKKLNKVFGEIEKAKENTEKNLQNAKDLFESYLQNIFVNPGNEWEQKTLKELTSILGDGLHGTPKYTINGEYYFINGNNLDDGKISFKENTKRVSVVEYEKYKKNLNNKTILVSINGTLGNVAFYNNEKIILGKSACYFNLIDGVDKNFIKYFLVSPYFFKYAHKEATGATIKNVSLKTMRELKINLPLLKIQKSIVKKLDELSEKTKRLEEIYRQKLEDLEELKKSVLKQAFEGKL